VRVKSRLDQQALPAARGKVEIVKSGIHPTWYDDALVVCACGNTWRTGSTKKEIHTDVCSNCHPFYTGEQRIVDTAGQVERFMKRVSAKEQLAPKPEAPTKPTKKERRARARGDMRSGMRGAPPAAAEATEPAAASAQPQAPEAITLEPVPAGRAEEPVSLEPAEGTPVVESAAPVLESAAESEGRSPTAEMAAGQSIQTVQETPPAPEASAVSGTDIPEAAAEGAPGAQEQPARRRARAPRAPGQGEGEAARKPRPPRKPRAEKLDEPSAEKPTEPPADGTAPGEATGGSNL
jgi:large subunit ribosomal protein L31